MSHRIYRGGRLLLGGALLLAGCSGSNDMSDLQHYFQTVRQQPSPPLDPLPTFHVYRSHHYQAAALRDPFQPPTDSLPPATAANPSDLGRRPDPNRERETLERFPLDTLRFVGHLQLQGRRWAIVTAPDGLVYRVERGDYLGQNFGRITEVDEQQLMLLELLQQEDGEWIERPAALSLSEHR